MAREHEFSGDGPYRNGPFLPTGEALRWPNTVVPGCLEERGSLP
jgi:hypothetical protein